MGDPVSNRESQPSRCADSPVLERSGRESERQVVRPSGRAAEF
jgi:hypothetical protein